MGRFKVLSLAIAWNLIVSLSNTSNYSYLSFSTIINAKGARDHDMSPLSPLALCAQSVIKFPLNLLQLVSILYQIVIQNVKEKCCLLKVVKFVIITIHTLILILQIVLLWVILLLIVCILRLTQILDLVMIGITHNYYGCSFHNNFDDKSIVYMNGPTLSDVHSVLTVDNSTFNNNCGSALRVITAGFKFSGTTFLLTIQPVVELLFTLMKYIMYHLLKLMFTLLITLLCKEVELCISTWLLIIVLCLKVHHLMLTFLVLSIIWQTLLVMPFTLVSLKVAKSIQTPAMDLPYCTFQRCSIILNHFMSQVHHWLLLHIKLRISTCSCTQFQ